MSQKTTETKNKILSFINKKGPCLPVHIAKEIESSILFTSAFLSELLSEKKIKISHMKVGNSPIYYIPGQEKQLENFSEFLNSKQKEAFILLKEKKFIKDSEQEPSIRVALRTLRDFAKPFKKNQEIIWRYFSVPESDFSSKESKTKPKTSFIKENKSKEELDIFDKEKSVKEKDTEENIQEKIKQENKKSEKINTKKYSKKSLPKSKKSKSKSKKSSKSNKFFEKVKSYLNENSLLLKDIVDFKKKEIALLIEKNNEEKLLVAYNKKRINENDISKAAKKASELNIHYIILSKGGPLKRIESLIEDLKKMHSIKNFKSS